MSVLSTDLAIAQTLCVEMLSANVCSAEAQLNTAADTLKAKAGTYARSQSERH
jgi:hypothetical protein